MTEKRFIYDKFDIVGDFEENELKLYEIDNNPSNDLDESNLFYVYSTSDENIKSIVNKLNELTEESEQLRLQLNLCSDQRNEFHRGARENANCIGKLEKENEQLKRENGQLKGRIEEYIEQLKGDVE